MRAAGEDVPQPDRRFAALGNNRGLRRRAQVRARVARRSQDARMKGWPRTGTPQLTRQRALAVVTGAAQGAKVEAPPQRAEGRDQQSPERPLRWTDRRPRLQNVVDNCQRP